MPPKSRTVVAPSASVASRVVAASTTAIASSSSSRQRVSAQSSARLGLLSGLIEGTLVMMELMFGLAMAKATLLGAYRMINGLSADDEPPMWNSFCIHILSNLTILTWLTFRLSQKHQPTLPLGTMARKLCLWPLVPPPTLQSSTRRMLATVFCVHALGTLAMFLAQAATGRWLFSWANYHTQEKGWDYITGADMLLLAPLREELTFRGVMFAIFYLRGAAFKVAPAPVADGKDGANSKSVARDESLAWTSSWKLDCIVATSLAFGLVHLLNLFGSKFTNTYIILQVGLGTLLGAFYCCRFVLSENSLGETVGLHMINNIFSSFLPVGVELDLTDPLVSLPLTLTFAVYGYLTYQQYKLLIAMPPTPFATLIPSTSTIDDDDDATKTTTSATSSTEATTTTNEREGEDDEKEEKNK